MIPNIARISELECLRAYIQAQHVEHVKTEIDIALMMLGLSRFKRQLREADESARVLSYAREAIAEARRSVTLINCAESRAPLEPRIAELESIVEEFYCRA